MCFKTATAIKWKNIKFLKHYLKTQQLLVENGFKTPAAFEQVKDENLSIRHRITFFIKLHEHEKISNFNCQIINLKYILIILLAI